MTNSAPGFKKFPNHRIDVKPAKVRVQVKYQGELIADTTDALALQEPMGADTSTVAPVVYYLPRKDVKTERLVRTPKTRHCPFKGDATYYSMRDGGEDVVWSYETPYDEMKAIKGRLAFYPGKVEITTA
ncbi:MAG TPA: DUF427 domain-containing protein [Burkholderiales bacterium]|nr:DUF427 domain-containing protein [Burkholderiales bacterium]